MAISASISSIWAPAVLEALEKSLAYGQLFNRDYVGQVTTGATVKITSISDVSINAHTRDSAITWEALTDSTQDLSIDQEKYFAFMLDDADAVQSSANLMGAATRNAVYQLRDTIDSYLATVLASGTIVAGLGTSTTPLEINSSNVGSTLRLIARRLDDAKVPRNGRYVVLPPWAIEDLVAANITDSTSNANALASGMVGRYAGLDILVSHNVPNTTSAKYQIYAASTVSQTMAMQIENVEQMRLETYFADGVRGLAVYGAKATRPGAIVKSFWNEAAEA